MVRAPTKTCPNLFSLIGAIEPELLAAFFRAKPFELMKWLAEYMPTLGEAPSNAPSLAMLGKETMLKLGPLETEAARITTIAGKRGQFVLEELAKSKLVADRVTQMIGQRDELARSLWAYIYEAGVFEAAENSLHMRLYRRYDRHYQTFKAEPSAGADPDIEGALLSELLTHLKDTLKRGEGYQVDRFEVPQDGEEPASVMYLITHPNPPTSARDLDDNGNSTLVYFRPPGEAMIVYTPSTGRVHVRADSRLLRHQVSDAFISKVLGQEPSRQPIDFQAYDISGFRSTYVLDRPVFDDVEIQEAKVIRIEVSVEDLASRLAISTSIDGDLGKLVEGHSGLGPIIGAAIAVRFLEIAVRYRLRDRDEVKTLDFTVTDRNTCSVMSVDDPFERVLGHRLLRHWGIMREGRAPSNADSMQALPALLQLWEIGKETVTGAWLHERHIDSALLIDIGFLVPIGQDGDEDLDVLENDDGLGAMDVKVVSRPSGIELNMGSGLNMPGGPADRYRTYRVRMGWVAEHLKNVTAGLFGGSETKAQVGDLVALGTLPVQGRDVPIYLARDLSNDKTRATVDTQLRARKADGIGLVLQAGKAPGPCLGENVLTHLADHLQGSLPQVSLDIDSIKAVYLRDRVLASGGAKVEFKKNGDDFGTLFVPEKGCIDIPGAHRIEMIERLVRAHEDGRTPIDSAEFRGDIKDQSLSNIFGQPLWDKLKAGFLRSPKKPLWEIAT